MEPGVAKIPEPITREIMRMYALLHERFRPRGEDSGIVLSSRSRVGFVISSNMEPFRGLTMRMKMTRGEGL